MSTTTQQPQGTSFKVITKKELNARLKIARAADRERKAKGEPQPTLRKEWSAESFDSISKALSSQ